MSWLYPLTAPIPPKEEIKPHLQKKAKLAGFHSTGTPDTSRPVEIDGVKYKSISEAARQLGCSATRIYTLINEKWRRG